MPGGLFRKRRGSIWTAAAEDTPNGDDVIDLFAEDKNAEGLPLDDGDARQDAASQPFGQETRDEATPGYIPGAVSETPLSADSGESVGVDSDEDSTRSSVNSAGEKPQIRLLEETERRRGDRDPKRERRIWTVIMSLLVLAFVIFAFISLRVGKIDVYGNDQLPRELIVQNAGIEYGASMFFVRRHSHEDKLCEHPYIAEAEIKLVFPDTVNITVKERKEAAVIMGLSSTAVVDEDGYVLSIGQRASYEGLIKIYGVGAAGYQVNGHIGDMDDYSSHALTSLIAAIKESHVQDIIASVDLSNTLSVSMMTKDGFAVNLGTAEDLKAKLETLAILAPEMNKLGYTDGTLFIYTHGAPIYSPPSTPEASMPEDGEDGETEDDEYTYVPSDKADNTPSPSASPEPQKSDAPEE